MNGMMAMSSLDIIKGRCNYKYSIDDNKLSLLFIKGKERIEESYPLSELSPMLGYWKGYPHSTKKNLRSSALFVLAASLIFFFLDGWLWIFGFLLILEALRLFIYEAEFLLPGEYSVVSYKNGSDCVYLPRVKKEEDARVNFELSLKSAIEHTKDNET